ncbi:MAG: hypothetical protein K8S20_08935 [Chloroflexi bacterium]|nr:hypothetical protein [Chloroflexota bacterium]
MELLDKNNFVENKNGRVTESQKSYLKSGANIWFDLLLIAGIFVFAGYLPRLIIGLPIKIPLMVASGISLLWMLIRSVTLFKYYFRILPDVRENRITLATSKVGFHKRYVLQTEEITLSLPGDKNNGLLAGNLYETYYLPRTRKAISANLFRPGSEAQQAREFMLLFGQLLGFTETDVQANRAGELTPGQKMAILKRGWWVVLLVLFTLALALSQILPMLIDPAFLSDSIFFTICMGGLALLVIGVIFLSSWDATALMALLERKLGQKEGIISVTARTDGSGKSRRTRYYLGIGFDFEMQIPERTYEVLVDGLYCRLYFTPRTKFLASMEVLKSQEPNISNP